MIPTVNEMPEVQVTEVPELVFTITVSPSEAEAMAVATEAAVLSDDVIVAAHAQSTVSNRMRRAILIIDP